MKLAKDVVILDMRPVCTYTDYFVLATGQNPRQTKAIADEVHGRLKAEDRMIPRSIRPTTGTSLSRGRVQVTLVSTRWLCS